MCCEQEDKAPNSHGVKMVIANPLRLPIKKDSNSPIDCCRSLIILALAIGVFKAEDIDNLQVGESLHVLPHAQKWYDHPCY